MYKITAEHMTERKGAEVVKAANATDFNVIWWGADEVFTGFYSFVVDADAQVAYDMQTAIYEQNDGAMCRVEPFEWEE